VVALSALVNPNCCYSNTWGQHNKGYHKWRAGVWAKKNKKSGTYSVELVFSFGYRPRHGGATSFWTFANAGHQLPPFWISGKAVSLNALVRFKSLS
jgi:hypothetical protein